MNKLIKIFVGALTAIFLVLIGDIAYSMHQNDAEYLTEVKYGPFVYQDEIYVFSDWSSFPEEYDTGELDYIHSDFSDYFTVKRKISKSAEFLPELIGDKDDPEHHYLKVRKDTDDYAAKVSALRESGAIEQMVDRFEEFVIWECRQRHYSLEELEENGADLGYELQRFSFDRDYVQSLLESYKNTEPRVEDFKRDNTVYLLQAGTPDMSDFLLKYYLGVYRVPETSDIRLLPHFYVGLLFYENGKLYFGNYENEVTGEIKEVILEGIEAIP